MPWPQSSPYCSFTFSKRVPLPKNAEKKGDTIERVRFTLPPKKCTKHKTVAQLPLKLVVDHQAMWHNENGKEGNMYKQFIMKNLLRL